MDNIQAQKILALLTQHLTYNQSTPELARAVNILVMELGGLH